MSRDQTFWVSEVSPAWNRVQARSTKLASRIPCRRRIAGDSRSPAQTFSDRSATRRAEPRTPSWVARSCRVEHIYRARAAEATSSRLPAKAARRPAPARRRSRPSDRAGAAGLQPMRHRAAVHFGQDVSRQIAHRVAPQHGLERLSPEGSAPFAVALADESRSRRPGSLQIVWVPGRGPRRFRRRANRRPDAGSAPADPWRRSSRDRRDDGPPAIEKRERRASGSGSPGQAERYAPHHVQDRGIPAYRT